MVTPRGACMEIEFCWKIVVVIFMVQVEEAIVHDCH